jgi:methionyl-tRNA formyltransferase
MNLDSNKEKSLETIVFMMTIENVHGREMLNKLLEYNIPITSIIIEHKSKLAENTRNYLNTKIYEPKKFDDIIRNKKIPVHYVENFNDENSLELIEEIRPDYIVLGGSRIIKEPIIKKVKRGILNAHPAILPKYQGLDCVGWSILNNDPVGATVHFIDSGIDSGPIILQGFIDYSDCKSLIEVRIKAMKKCAELMLKSLIGLKFKTLQPVQQNFELSENHRAMVDEEISLVEKKLSNQKS